MNPAPDSRGPMTFTDRLRASGLSLWEVGDLLGIHPHHLHDRGPHLHDRPVTVLIEIARQLDMHPADLIPELDDVLGNRRQPATGDPVHDGADHDGDARVVLTALATATVPLTADMLATALEWPLTRTDAALTHAQAHPRLAGPMAIRRIPPEAYTLKPRLDVLTKDQHRAVVDTTRHHSTLAEDEAIALLRVIAHTWRECPHWEQLSATDQHRYAETALKHAGILYSDSGPHRVFVTEDVLYSLRYRDDVPIARQLGEDVPPDPYHDPWPGTLELDQDGIPAAGQSAPR